MSTLAPGLVAIARATAAVGLELMGLTADQKLACYQLCQDSVPMMSSAEYLRASQVSALNYSTATDPVAMAALIVTEVSSYRTANGSPTISVGSGFYVDPSEAQKLAKLG